jgi:3D (Asp-Asp-Asp) domain-containing protein
MVLQEYRRIRVHLHSREGGTVNRSGSCRPSGRHGRGVERREHRHFQLRRFATLAVGLLAAAYVTGCSSRQPAPRPVPPRSTSTREVGRPDTYVATAYSLHGRTASGTTTRPGIVAADPSVLPLGSQIRVSNAGTYSGTYTVADTGGAIGGRRIDVYIPNHAEARRFGRRTVRVQVLRYASSPKSGLHEKLRHSGRRHRRVCKTNTGHRCA